MCYESFPPILKTRLLSGWNEHPCSGGNLCPCVKAGTRTSAGTGVCVSSGQGRRAVLTRAQSLPVPLPFCPRSHKTKQLSHHLMGNAAPDAVRCGKQGERSGRPELPGSWPHRMQASTSCSAGCRAHQASATEEGVVLMLPQGTQPTLVCTPQAAGSQVEVPFVCWGWGQVVHATSFLPTPVLPNSEWPFRAEPSSL